MKVTIKEWNSVATWQWDIPEDDVCGICQYPENAAIHCIMEWIKQESAKGQCPMCRQPFEWQDQANETDGPHDTPIPTIEANIEE
ncbi:hypothetical protein THARTR1_04400 [Trichoderma harzianum]|uniref:Anaphase-promoting complex subunit 11 RING-H2 finger domain-containing protein n=1 Tax=Trichoderma harzianum TaxID=5544 RepID=A0A2K0UBV4_TRIHA|nr:hypothetical protein THARTR1_04400 [Trichoderma harzianum]